VAINVQAKQPSTQAATAATTLPATNQADSPQAAVTEFYAALDAADAKAAEDRAVVSDEDRDAFKALISFSASAKRLLQLADTSFGKGADIGLIHATAKGAAILNQAKVTIDGNTAKIVSLGATETLHLVKTDEHWRIDLSLDPVFKDPRALAGALAAQSSALNKVADQLEAGAYRSRDELRKAVMATEE